MKKTVLGTTVLMVALSGLAAEQAKNPHANNPRLPDGFRVHDSERPLPPVITPGNTASDAPSDAIVLFNGSDLSEWVGTVSTNKNRRYNPKGEALWTVKDGYMEINGTGSLTSRKKFGDCQIHLEWAAPDSPKDLAKRDQGRGNSGVFIMGKYEVQILDCYENTSYADGMTASVYGQHPALANACRPAGEWQTYDIIFTAPRFDKDGNVVSPARVTVIHNGILVQNNTEFLGLSTYKRLPVYKAHEDKGPITLQDHNNPIRFRNIWVRDL